MKNKFLFSVFFIFLSFFVPGLLYSAEPRQIASFSTSIQDQTREVKKNIFLAVQKLNGYVLYPKSIFSFNEVVGEGSARNGFVNGRVLYRDTIRYEPGGGLCQVSSTLFNAFLVAGFRKVERHRHFQPVTYVPLGLDATIKYGKKDLRMKNIYNFPIYIQALMNDKSLNIILTAQHMLPFRFELTTEEEVLENPILNQPQMKKMKRVRRGISVYVYRKKFFGKKLIETFLLYKDYYPAVYFKR